ncbi:hypothetical protein KSD_73980 [Ktedonobacter sp. SOSP1-85]|nr:hypothetical protein KSD_73980 [Ktedonobacter sp. SOSP1-85]
MGDAVSSGLQSKQNVLCFCDEHWQGSDVATASSNFLRSSISRPKESATIIPSLGRGFTSRGKHDTPRSSNTTRCAPTLIR